ncbi:MAG: ATP-binding protein [Planctomycetota bacterium]
MITRTIKKAQQEMVDQSQVLWKSNTPAALDTLTQIFGLNSFDRAILMLCLAPEIDPAFERLYAYIQDEVPRKYITVHLALSLFTTERENGSGLRQSFLPEAPLFRFKLIEREHSTQLSIGWNSGPLRINPRIADYLQGINRLDERVADFLKPVPPVESLPQSYQEIVDKLRHLIETNEKRFSPTAINLTGSGITGKRNVSSRLCEVLRIELYRLNLKQLQASGIQGHDIAPVLERECLLLPAAIFIDASELEDNNDPSKTVLEALIEDLNVFFILSSREPWRSEGELLIVSIPKLKAGEQVVLWKQQLGHQGICLDGQIDTLVEQFDFESDMIAKTITSASSKSRMREGKTAETTGDDIWSACRELSRNDLEGLAQRIIPCYGWEDIVLPREIFEQLHDIAAQVAHRALVYEKWGYGAKLSRGRGISALFSGVSGTGKTMAAEILANHLKLDLYRIDLSAVVSKYIGETEKNLRRVFDAAEQSGAILFFDEADALFGKRSEVKDSHDRYANIEINYLLQRMEDYRGLAILATNMKSLLDQAFLRRLRFHVEFPFPDSEYRRQIWQKSFPSQTTLGNIDYHFLGRLKIPGGNIKNIALNAAFLAADDGQVIEMNHLLRATKREYTKIGKMVLESEFGSYYERVKP